MSSRFLRSLSLFDDFLGALAAAPFLGAFGVRGTSSPSSSSLSLSFSLSKSWFICLRPLQGCEQPLLCFAQLDAANCVCPQCRIIPLRLCFPLHPRVHRYLGVHAQNLEPDHHFPQVSRRIGELGESFVVQCRRDRAAIGHPGLLE